MTEQSPDELVKNVRAEHDRRRQERSSRATKSRKQVDIIACWQRAYLAEDRAERYVTPTRKEVGIFLRHYTRFANGRDIRTLLESVVERWDDLRLGPLSWHDGFPRTPSFGFVAHHLRFFLQGLNDLQSAPRTKNVEGKTSPRRSWEDVKRVD